MNAHIAIPTTTINNTPRSCSSQLLGNIQAETRTKGIAPNLEMKRNQKNEVIKGGFSLFNSSFSVIRTFSSLLALLFFSTFSLTPFYFHVLYLSISVFSKGNS